MSNGQHSNQGVFRIYAVLQHIACGTEWNKQFPVFRLQVISRSSGIRKGFQNVRML